MSADWPNPKKLCKERPKVLLLMGERKVGANVIVCMPHIPSWSCNTAVTDSISRWPSSSLISLTLKMGRVIPVIYRSREGGREGGSVFIRTLGVPASWHRLVSRRKSKGLLGRHCAHAPKSGMCSHKLDKSTSENWPIGVPKCFIKMYSTVLIGSKRLWPLRQTHCHLSL